MYEHSGIGRYLRNLVPLLVPQLRADRIRVLGQRRLLGEAAWMGDPRVEVVETAAPIYSVQEQRMDTRAKNASDVLWVPHFNAPLLRRGRMVVTMHDVAPLAMPQILGNTLKRAYAKLLIERAVSQATEILCVSAFTRDELRTRLDVPENKMTVTRLGLDAEWPVTATPHTEEDGSAYLLYVGNVKPNKNLALLLEAFAMVMDRLPYRLVVAGRLHGFGTGDDAVLRRAADLGDRVRFAGEVSDAELQRLYAGAAALVLPSLYEGFGLPMLEAMKLGCPVLSSTAGSLPEVGGDAAMYFDPHLVEELVGCLLQVENRATMDALRMLGRERVKMFSFVRCAEQTAAVMNRVMEAA
jgi:glycosyltransferase involved in cell wall biosynthesis